MEHGPARLELEVQRLPDGSEVLSALRLLTRQVADIRRARGKQPKSTGSETACCRQRLFQGVVLLTVLEAQMRSIVCKTSRHMFRREFMEKAPVNSGCGSIACAQG